jgi:sec-independent protein translocase protein TatC
VSQTPHTADEDADLPFLAHLIELRDRLLRSVISILVIFAVLFPFANDLYGVLVHPLVVLMPEGAQMVAIDVASPFIAPLKLVFVLSIYIAVPMLFYQIWGFVAPGLYKHEQRLVMPLLISSTLLFYAGVLFAYFLVFPLIFGFFISVLPADIQMSTDISSFLNFALKMFFAFGVAFEVPILTILLIWTGFTTADSLAAKRPYLVVGAFVIAMLLTPPDIFSQTLLAGPMLILFEVGLLVSRYFVKPKIDDEDEEDAENDDTYPEDYAPMTGHEMDAELDRLDAEDAKDDDDKEAQKKLK